LRDLDGQRSREELWKNCPGAKSICNSSTIIPQFFSAALPDKGPQNLSKKFPQFFPLAVYISKETKIPQQFCGKIVEEFGACQIRGRIFLATADYEFARKRR
jgi:hypothetical protein